jgi:hypothetical protein
MRLNIIIAIIFLSNFYWKIYKNNIFLFFKFIFNINIKNNLKT